MTIFDSRDQYLAFASIMHIDKGNGSPEYKYQLNLMLQFYAIWMFRIYHLYLLSILISAMLISIFGYHMIYLTVIIGFVIMKMFLTQKCKNIKLILDIYD